MTAAAGDRRRVAAVERVIGTQLRVDEATAIDRREDEVRGRLHRHVHQLERLDELDDDVRDAIREDLRLIAGILDGVPSTQPEQLSLVRDEKPA